MKGPLIKRLDRYIIGKFIGTYLFTLLIVILVVIVFDLSEKIGKFVENSVPLSEIVLQYYAGFIPWMLNSFSPLFVFIAVIFFTSKLATNSEIIAILSSGVSFRRLMVPYIFSAALITAFSLFMSLSVIPPANKMRLDFENKYIKSKQRSAEELSNLHYQISPGQFVYVEQYSPWANTCYRFTLETIEGGRVLSKLSAESAAWDSTFCGWTLRNYYQRDFYGESEVVVTGRTKDTIINLTIDDFSRRKNFVEWLTGPELNEVIETQRMRGDPSIKRSLIEKNNRVATPFSAFVLTVMAVALSSRKRRGGTGINIGVGLALSFSYILFMRFSQMFVYTGALSPAFAMWLPNILYAAIAAVLYRIAPK